MEGWWWLWVTRIINYVNSIIQRHHSHNRKIINLEKGRRKEDPKTRNNGTRKESSFWFILYDHQKDPSCELISSRHFADSSDKYCLMMIKVFSFSLTLCLLYGDPHVTLVVSCCHSWLAWKYQIMWCLRSERGSCSCSWLSSDRWMSCEWFTRWSETTRWPVGWSSLANDSSGSGSWKSSAGHHENEDVLVKWWWDKKEIKLLFNLSLKTIKKSFSWRKMIFLLSVKILVVRSSVNIVQDKSVCYVLMSNSRVQG